ncbi:glycosyltransferase family 4 protein [Microlunatus soli]|uniref:Glycosyltransferase involved in cell wall bisynthesis n=1 Tax=Microlunatus soli TaxID=630515 RepID=A0A1H1NX32_9ACTN|nr:glycosyltransferase family 4 protein [Microlunatus soli]SDS03538.1 Glycosyltransferase involved in cell wall bisynthesis [Microlunatus soli]
MINRRPIHRIALVCTDPGIGVFGTKGAAVHVQSVLQVLVDAGCDVHVITPRPGPVHDHRLARLVTVHRLPEISAGPAAERERAAQRSDAGVAAVLDAVDPDLVYERYSLWGRTATAWSNAHRVPSILEVNSPLITEQAVHRELADADGARTVARQAFGAADVISCVSDGVADWVGTMTGRTARILVLPNGVDTDRIRPAERPAVTGDQSFVVGFLGTLKAWHGVDTLIDALAEVDQSGTAGWRLLVVGDGPLRAGLERHARQRGVDAEFTGAIDADRVGQQLQRMDVGCAPYPASTDHYFSPLKVFEYLAAGLPVLASAIGQIPGILDHGRLGRLVAPGDRRALAAALAEIRPDRDERVRLAIAGRDAAVERHTWSGVVEQAFAAAGAGLGRPVVGAG